jgi:hypothetical protein
MAFDLNKPADNQTIAAGPGDIRENFRAIKDDKLVNAQKLMDYSPGNASGKIPVSNGTVNTNLNADLLDGRHGSYYSPEAHTHTLATTAADGFLSNTDKQKLDGIFAGAEVNQNAFSNVTVSSTTLQADNKTDTLTIAAGTGITLTPDAAADKVTITVAPDGHGHTAATATAAGFMAAADKSKLNGIAAGAEVNQNAFAKVVAGGATIAADGKTDTLTINAGAGITVTGDGANDALSIAVTANGHTHPDASGSASGLMSTADKTKLNGIAAGAEVNQNAFVNVLVGTTKIQADGKSDTLELAAGTNISLTPDATNDRVTITVSGTVDAAKNANALGNLDVGQFVRASGQVVSGDLNNYRRPGMYIVNEWTNISNYPVGAYAWGTLVVFRGSNADSHSLGQLYLSHGGSQMWYRGGNGTGGWQPWKQIATIDGNVATATTLQTARKINGVSFNGGADIAIQKVDGNQIWHAGNLTPANYLPLSGGTITDKLAIAKSIGTSGSHYNCQLELRAGDSTGQVALGFRRPGYTAACLRHQGNGLELIDANGNLTPFKAGVIYSEGSRIVVSKYATSGDIVLYSAATERSTKETVYKKFRVEWPGHYRVKFQLKGFIRVYVTSGGYTSETVTSSNNSYVAHQIEIFVNAPHAEILIVGKVNQDYYNTRTAYLKGATLCYGGYTEESGVTYGTLLD